MSDIRITLGKNRATIFGQTPKGRIWMRQSMIDVRDEAQTTYVMINAEEAGEVAKVMCDAGLIVEM